MSYLKGIYGKGLVVHCGKIHDYLGMDLDYIKDGKVKVCMIKYLIKVIQAFPELIKGSASSPAAKYLFKIQDNNKAVLLPEEQAQVFHHVVAQLLFMSQQAHRYLQTPTSFLTTRVKEPQEDDWGKLKWVLKYLNSTKHMKLTLSADNLSTIR